MGDPHFFRKAKSKVIQEELEKLVDPRGKLDPEVVVKAARKKNHPLHDYFEWDAKKAAHAYRIDQARTLIREVKVEVKTSVTQVTAVSYVKTPRPSPTSGATWPCTPSSPRLRQPRS
jgi:hypothetical protein